MPTILHVNASPRGHRSSSLQLAQSFLGAVQQATGPGLNVETLNLFDDGALPEFGATAAAAKMAVFAGQDLSSEQACAWQSARAVFEQFAAADAYVFNIPMWNAGVPYVLKQWIDLVTQPGWSFGFHPESGYTGLITGKQAVAIHTSGVYAPGIPSAFGQDFSSPFFADWLQFVGITDATHIRFAPTVAGSGVEASRRQAEDGLREAADIFASRLIRPSLLQPVNS